MSFQSHQSHPGAALWETGRQQFDQGQWDAAMATYLKLLDLVPGHAQSLLQLSYVESHLGHHRNAHDYTMRALAQNVKRPQLLTNLVARLRTFNEGEALLKIINGLPPLKQIEVQALLGFAAQMSYLNEQQRALTFLDEAKRADPDFPTTLMARGQILTYLGRLDEAEADFERCIARAPELAQAHWFVARLRKQSADSNHIERLRHRLTQPFVGPEDEAMLQYALHKELDDLGAWSSAFRALRKACRAKRRILHYDARETHALVEQLMAWRAPVATTTEQADSAHTPIFIVGMHRSGTTLLEQLLDGHSDVRGVGELYDFTSQMRYATDHHCRGVIDKTIVERAGDVDFAQVGSEYLRRMQWRLGEEKFFTDKLPSNFLNIGFICQALPQAKILHMVRDPIETCFSNLRELFAEANAYSYDQLELADFQHCYRRLMKHWHETWPGRILDVNYTELTRDPEATMRRVAAFCGIPYEPNMLALGERDRGVATASAIQVRQGITVRKQPKWAPYETYLHPLIQALRV